MQIYVLFREPWHQGQDDHRIWITPFEFAPFVAERIEQQRTWIQIVWFRVWLKWQLLSKGAVIPAALHRYPDPEIDEYCEKLRRAGLAPVGHNIFRSLPSEPGLPAALRKAAHWYGLQSTTGSEPGPEYIDLTNYRFADVRFMMAAALEGHYGRVYCAACAAEFFGAEIARTEWTAPPAELTGGGGRTFTCPNKHTVFATMDWIS